MSGRHRASPPPRRGRGRHRRPAPRTHLLVPAVTVMAVLAGGGAAWGIAESGSGTPHTAASGPVAPPPLHPPLPPVATTGSPRPSPAATHRPPHHAHRPAVPRPTLALTISGHASYVAVSRNGHLLTQRILHHGQHLTYRRHGLVVVLGNAGDVRLSVNGSRPRRAGAPGEVLNLRVR